MVDSISLLIISSVLCTGLQAIKPMAILAIRKFSYVVIYLILYPLYIVTHLSRIYLTTFLVQIPTLSLSLSLSLRVSFRGLAKGSKMRRSQCCEKVGLKKGPWTPEEDQKLLAYIEEHGIGSWRALPPKAGRFTTTLMWLMMSWIT
jgi:hypothetical protein